MNKQELIKQCRYYKGEDKCPYAYADPRFTAWRIERIWVGAFDRDSYVDSCIDDYVRRGMGSYRMTDSVPLSLKAVLMNRFFHYADREVIDDFKAFYEKLY